MADEFVFDSAEIGNEELLEERVVGFETDVPYSDLSEWVVIDEVGTFSDEQLDVEEEPVIEQSVFEDEEPSRSNLRTAGGNMYPACPVRHYKLYRHAHCESCHLPFCFVDKRIDIDETAQVFRMFLELLRHFLG